MEEQISDKTNQIHIERMTSRPVDCLTHTPIEEGTLGLSIKSDGPNAVEQYSWISIDNIVYFYQILKGLPDDEVDISSQTDVPGRFGVHEGIDYKNGRCAICGKVAAAIVDAITFGRAWIHYQCKDEFIELLDEWLSEYSEEITARKL